MENALKRISSNINILISYRMLSKELLSYFDSSININKIDVGPLINLIKVLIDFFIEGDRGKQAEIFDVFDENKILQSLTEFASFSHYQIMYSLIQTFSFLLVNISNKKTLNYILSNNIINHIICIDILQFDDEFLAFYINFLKSLSLRIDENIIELFYNKATNSFPLIEYSLQLYNYNNAMISTVVHGIILAVLNIKYDPIADFFTSLPTVNYFIFLSCHLRDLILNYLKDPDDSNVFDDIVDEVMYISDILCVHNLKINYIFLNALFSYIILPIICNKIVHNESTNSLLAIILIFFSNVKEEAFLNMLYSLLFLNAINKNVVDLIKTAPKENKIYFSEWNKQKEYTPTFKEYICNKYTLKFLFSLKYEDNLIYSKLYIEKKGYKEFNEIKGKIAEFMKKGDDDSKLIENIVKVVKEYFTIEELKDMEEFHSDISQVIGMKIGMLNNEDDNNDNLLSECFLNYMYSYYMNNGENIQNPISKSFHQMSEMDNPITAKIFGMLIWVLRNKVNISRVLLDKAGLIITDEENDNNKTKEKKEENILQLFSFDNNFLLNSTLPIDDIQKIYYPLNKKLIQNFLNVLDNYRESIPQRYIEMICIDIFILFNDIKNSDLIPNIDNIYNKIKQNAPAIRELDENVNNLMVQYSSNVYNNEVFDKEIKCLSSIVEPYSNKTNSQIDNINLVIMIYLENLLQNKNFIIQEISPEYKLQIYSVNSNYLLKDIQCNKKIVRKLKLPFVFISDGIFFYLGRKIDNDYIKIEFVCTLSSLTKTVTKENNNFSLNLGKSRVLFSNTTQDKRDLDIIVTFINSQIDEYNKLENSKEKE